MVKLHFLNWNKQRCNCSYPSSIIWWKKAERAMEMWFIWSYQLAASAEVDTIGWRSYQEMLYVRLVVHFWLNGNSLLFVFGTTATLYCREKNKNPRDKDVTICSSNTHSMFCQQPKERKRCKPTAMMRYRMWLRSNSPHNNKVKRTARFFPHYVDLARG